MRKRLTRLMVLGAAGLMVMTLGTAHAASLDIDEADGAVLHSVPGLPAGLDYPDSINDEVSGTATIDYSADDAGVQIEFWTTQDNERLTIYTGQATLGCTGSACTWTFRVPFVLPPGSYKMTASLFERNPILPEDPAAVTASKTINVNVL